MAEVTRTNMYFGRGYNAFVRLIKDNFCGGKCVLIYDNRDNIIELDKLLGAEGYTVKGIKMNSYMRSLPEDGAFVVAVVGVKWLPKVKNLIKNLPLCYYTSDYDYSFFGDSDLIGGERYACANFVYFVNEPSNFVLNSSYVYAGMFVMLTQLVAIRYDESIYPFEDKGMTGIINALIKTMTVKQDADSFLADAMRLIKMAMDYLQKRDKVVILVNRCVKDNDVGQKIIYSYFLNLALVMFTKWDFFDMLIPAEKLTRNVDSFLPNHRDSDCLLSKETLSAIMANVRRFVQLPSVSAKATFVKIMEAIDGSVPLFAKINNRGILLGIVNYGKA